MSSIWMVKHLTNPFTFFTGNGYSHLENKQLDRQEYNLWTIRTTGEEITDDDWLSIRGEMSISSENVLANYFSLLEHSHLDRDENISRDKFLKLNDFEVQNKDTTEQDLWTGLKSLGFNYELKIDMVCYLIFSLMRRDFLLLSRCVHLI